MHVSGIALAPKGRILRGIMPARPRRRSRQTSRWLMALLALGLLVLLAVLMAPTIVMSWVRGYLQKEAFRTQMEAFLGTRMAAQVTLAPLHWTGDEVTTKSLQASTLSGWKAEVHGLHLALDWPAFRNRQWRIIQTGADSLDLTYQAGTKVHQEPLHAQQPSSSEAAQGGMPGWLKAYLPDSTEIDGIRFDHFSASHPGPWKLSAASLRIGTWRQGEASVQATIDGGILETPVQLPVQLHPMKFNLSRASLRLSRDDLHLTNALLNWVEDSEISASGHMRPQDQSWELKTSLSSIPLRELLSEDWRLRLTGTLHGDLEIRGQAASPPQVEGDIQLKNTVLTALPVLDKLASYTRVERFKRLSLDIASAQVRGSGEVRQFDKVVIQSNGLLRIEGSMNVNAGQVDGRFMLGVTPETLKWIPGAQQHVFTSTHPGAPAGMMWTPLHVTGTVDAPREDLTERLIGGAGKALLNAPAEVVGKVGEAVLSPVIGPDLSKKPGEVLKGATDTLTHPDEAVKKASEAAGKGIDLLKGLGSGLLGR